jgi:uncharacterized protein (DUF433 family)
MITLERSPVTSDPMIVGGALVFRNTRVLAQTLLDYINAGDSVELFLKHFPTVSREDAEEFLGLVREEGHT